MSALAAVCHVFMLAGCKPNAPDYDTAVCAGPPLRDVAKRNEAMEKGYAINPRYDCIDRASFEAVQRAEAEHAAAQAARKPAAPVAGASVPEPAVTFAELRASFTTAVALSPTPEPLPTPPAALYQRLDFRSGALTLPAFVTPDPRDGAKHPAIVWISGGDSATLGEFWIAGPAHNDQSAQQFREAGLVMMLPTLRGGNEHAGPKQWFAGEVDDVIAAADRLASLPYVDPARIYLGGHSTGGTLALLAAEASGRFAGVFAYGPVADAGVYPQSLVPIDYARLDARERKLRSPVHWLAEIRSPTWIIEGQFGNAAALHSLCERSHNPRVSCIEVPGGTHFNILAPGNRAIASKILAKGAQPLELGAADFSPAAR